MKKLIPILSIAVLVSCTNTTKPNLATIPQNIIPLSVETSPLPTPPLATTTKYKNTTNKVASKSKTGVASWYGNEFHGKKTATGELFDMNAMTAAHNTLPLDSYAEITNTENNRTVIVRINDRGPFFDKRILDLSYSAAKQLGMDEAGTSKVAIKSIAPEQALKQLQQQNQSVYLQIGSFRDKKLAQDLLVNLKKQHLPESKIASSSSKKTTLYKVFVPIQSAHNASNLNDKLAKLGITATQFVTETN
ncbi:MAG: septal ring lytic transglycosylase RlpA family protein [Methylococcaceae bacterium]|jgi:rare lipoprotein A